jgi:hypothetical protein
MNTQARAWIIGITDQATSTLINIASVVVVLGAVVFIAPSLRGTSATSSSGTRCRATSTAGPSPSRRPCRR